MPRTARLIVKDEPAVYHVISRTALPGYPIGDVEKEFLLGLIQRLTGLYFTETIGFCLMGNHFHILVKMRPEGEFSDAQVHKRLERFYGDTRFFDMDQLPYWRAKLASLSELMREIKQRFARWYNKKTGRRGYFWGDRFKSVIVDKGETLVNCLAYIDLNPMRAGLVERPEDYRWCSLGYHLQTDNKGDWLSTDFGLKEFNVESQTERIRLYRRYVYETGGVACADGKSRQVINPRLLEKERRKDFKFTATDRLRCRTRYFTDSGVIGSKQFVSATYQRFAHLFASKKERTPKPIQGLNGIYSLKRLSEWI